jgi:ribonuclease HI
MEHLLNSCYYSQQIWDWGAQAMRRSQRNRGSIRDTLVNWETISFHNPILQRIWHLLPGFTLWSIWKERNNRIFNSRQSPPTNTWERTKRLIRETIHSQPWSHEDMQCKPEEGIILNGWNMQIRIQPQGRSKKRTDNIPTHWAPPPHGAFKLNFDGASRGNPGPAGFGAVLRNHTGEIILMIAGSLGENTNNVAELTSLVRGLQTAVHHQFHRLVIEGDSQVIIQLITKILHGKPPWRISPSWRLSGLLEDFSDIINPNLTLIPSHVKREANKIADHLANAGIDANAELIFWQASDSEETDLSRFCRDLARKELTAPDGVTRRPGVTGGFHSAQA